MSRSVCRLCLSTERLVDVFDARLANSRQLRMCIVLCTGVEIKENDTITKMSCHRCCSVAVHFFKYRQNALKNDKALKAQLDQPNIKESMNEEDLLALHKSITDNLSQMQTDKSKLGKIESDCEPEKSDTSPDKHTFQYFPDVAVQKITPDEKSDNILNTRVPPHTVHTNDSEKNENEIESENKQEASTQTEEFFNREDVPKHVDSDSDAGVDVFKSRKRKLVEPSEEDSLNESESEVDENYKRVKKPCKTRSSKNKTPKINYQTFVESDSDYDIISDMQRKAGMPRNCQYCHKVCFGRSDLNSHEITTHRKCLMCGKIFKSPEALEAHLKNVCYKEVKYKQPYLELSRVDQEVDVVKQYQEAFDYYFQAIEDGIYGKDESDEVKKRSFDKNFPLYHTEEHIKVENEFIASVFDKFRDVENKVAVKNKSIQARRPPPTVQYGNQNQIAIQNMYDDVLTYKIPIQMVINKKMYANISFTSKPQLKKTMDNWTDAQKKDVVIKDEKMNACLQSSEVKFCFPRDKIKENAAPPLTKSKTFITRLPVGKVINKLVTNKTQPNKIQPNKTQPNKTQPNKTQTIKTQPNKTQPINTQPNRIIKIVSSTGGANSRPKFFNIARILTSSPSAVSQKNVPKTNATPNQPHTNSALKDEPDVDEETPTQTTPINTITNNASITNTSTNQPITNAKTNNTTTNVSGILPNIILKTEDIQPDAAPNNPNPYQQNLIFRFPLNSGTQHQQHAQNNALYQKQTNPQVYLSQARRANVVQNKYPVSVNMYKNFHNANILPSLSQQPNNVENDIKPNVNQLSNMNMLQNNLSHLPSISLNQPRILNTMSHLSSMNHMPSHQNINHLTNNINQIPNMNHISTNINMNHMSGNITRISTNLNHMSGNPNSNMGHVSNNINHNGMSHVPNNINHNNMGHVSNNMSVSNNMGHVLNNMSHVSNNMSHVSNNMSHVSNNMNHVTNAMNHHQSNHPHMNSMYSHLNSISSPINSIPSPINSAASPINSVPSPITSVPSPINSVPSSNNSYGNTYNYSGTYGNSYGGDGYSAGSYEIPTQYIPPYSANGISDYDPYGDATMQQPIGSDTKSFIRVKQPWELNQV